MSEAHGLVHPLGQEQLDILEQKTSAIRRCHRSWSAAGPKIGRLRENPGISQDATADQHAFDARLHPLDDLDGLYAVSPLRTPGSSQPAAIVATSSQSANPL